jgi:acylphosphatase
MALVGMQVYVSGLVQGVAFRYSAIRQARSLAVNGWVKNLRDGRVELLFEGEKSAVEQMLEWCHHGPPGARVTDVRTKEYPYSGRFSSFELSF